MRSDTSPAGARDLSAIWRATSDRITEIVRTLPDTAAYTPVPTVPGIAVRDVIAHLIDTARLAGDDPAGAARESVALPAPGAAGGARLAELVVGWEKATAALDASVAADAGLASLLITIAVMSEHDLRSALGVPGARDDIAVKVALDELSGRFSDRVAAAGLSPLRVTVEQWGTIAGDGRAIACVVADRFEFVRAMSGRRSADEIGRWNWGVEPNTYLSVISEVGLPANEIRERDPRIPEHMRDREFVL
ncbi:maleylpyruvate isomerase N-terminal domain-containing protein [Mycobacterium paraseoulense]|uniref:Mycothiol-dependent maleylpyruvate isomerase metal-binding domain-containing protein n=1 Tax=Mycobacterium paraseoulense TaxID=590652 RepID=A0A1X0IGN8_9MYCO|nr:maleylpyruvate isomerase N-terminal domain-containing protein [Mycobacterium paraseoulense]MCV7393736.1 maleylpyruvate isomerase N-terminal domain-containing protein [Mycobacterium paraseoulense]ORB45519.1 hypothetical protein BST39_04745 [Mycobacterium paraseoulense]BBZ70646.1 hypothetical protein MPRS_17390 [Mycobacterium paraseoulense]